MHPTLIDHISAKIKDIILVLSQDGACTKALQLNNDFWPKCNTKATSEIVRKFMFLGIFIFGGGINSTRITMKLGQSAYRLPIRTLTYFFSQEASFLNHILHHL